MVQNKIPQNEYGRFNGWCIGNIRTCIIPLYLYIVHMSMAINLILITNNIHLIKKIYTGTFIYLDLLNVNRS